MFEGIDNAYPLTPLQEGILYEVLKAEDTDVYVAYVVLDIQGQLDEPLFKNAWRQTLLEHDTLRTRFIWEGLDEPLQLVDSDVTLQWNSVEPLTDDTEDLVIARWLSHERQTPLSLSENAPLRFTIIRHCSERSTLIWTVHHLLADDWSTPVVLSRVMAHYSALSLRAQSAQQAELEELPTVRLGSGSEAGAEVCAKAKAETSAAPALAFGDYVDWLASTDFSTSRAWWQEQLTDVQPTPIAFKGCVPETINDGNGNCHPRLIHTLGSDAAGNLRAFSLRAGVTQSSLFHAAWALTVSQFAGSHRPVFGTSVSGRTCPLPGIDHAVGLFLNTLPTSVLIDPNVSPVDFVQAVQLQLFEQLSNEHVPLSELQRMNSTGVPLTLFESVLVVESHGTQLELASEGSMPISFGTIRYETDSNYPLTVLVFPGDVPQVHILASRNYMDASFLPVLADAFANNLGALCNDELADIASLLHAQQSECASYLPVCAPPERPAHTRIDDWIVDTARKHPDAVALAHGEDKITYSQLLDKAELMATAIRQCDVQGDCIGLYIGRSIDQVVGVLAIMLSDKGYLALDVEWPLERIRLMTETAGVTLILSRERERAALADFAATILCVDSGLNSQIMAYRHQPITTQLEVIKPIVKGSVDNNLAYLMFTSGSTGVPKAVPITHQNLLYSTAARFDYYPTSPDAFLLLSSLAFDSSVAGLFWTLCSGGTLVLQNDEHHNDVHELVDLIAEHSVTHTLCLPSIYSLLLQFGHPQKLASLGTVMVAGEACPDQLPSLHTKVLPTAALYNEYGPTEATVWSTVACLRGAVTPNDDTQACRVVHASLSIGQPIPGAQIHIEAPNGLLCPPGVLGEIIISGPGVVSGYRHDEVSSARSFAHVEHRGDTGLVNAGAGESWGDVRRYASGDQGYLGLDGQLYFQGRIDDQVKIRGNRVEPAEITWRVDAQAGVAEAYCLAMVPDPQLVSAQQLFCFVVPAGFQQPGACQLLTGSLVDKAMQPIVERAKRQINDELPTYFQVFRFVAVSRLPRLPNGKIDKHGFVHPGLDFSNEQTAVESAAIHSSILRVVNTSSPIQEGTSEGSVSAHAGSSETIDSLCKLLASQLGIDSVAASDNFFSLGGDSLSAIRFVALCREHGLALSIPMITQYASLARLGDALDESVKLELSAAATRVPVEAFGDTPLTPIQRWFFTQAMPHPEQWNMGFLVSLEAPIPVASLKACVQAVVESIPVLGTHFKQHDNEWVAHIPRQPDTHDLVHCISTPENKEAWSTALLEAQKHFNLNSGQLVRIVLGKDATDGYCRTLGVVIHHLVTDALSNRFLADRIVSTARVAATKAQRLDTSYRDWATLINTPHCNETDIGGSSTQGVGESSNEPLTVSSSSEALVSPWTESRVVSYCSCLDGSLVSSLRVACDRLDVQLHEAVLFALWRSSCSQTPVKIDVEMHGRDLLADDIDVSGSIGWFTSFFNVRFEPASMASIDAFKDCIRASRELGQRDFINEPESFVNNSTNFRSSSTSDLCVPILYNYLAGTNADSAEVEAQTGAGHLCNAEVEREADAEAVDSLRNSSFIPLLDEGLRHPASPRSHPIDCIVLDGLPGQLEVLWRVDNEVLSGINMADWQAQFLESLHTLCTDAENTSVSSEDEFADSGLEDEELEKLLAGF